MRASLPLAAIVAMLCVASARGDAATRLSLMDAGAVGDGATLNTPAIQAAIDRLAAAGGGTIVVPEGRFRSGAIFLKPRVHLHLERGGELLGSADIADYPEMPTRIEGATNLWRPALVNADRCDGLRITGEGTIRGGGKPFWEAFLSRRKADPKTKNLDVPRPRNVFIRDSNGVLVEGVSLRDSGFWNLHLYRCRDATIERVDIRAPGGAPSSDGIDVDSCQDVTIRGCYVSTDDDNIALKGTKGPMADRDADSPAVERIRIVSCTFGNGHGVVTIGSEASVVRGITVEDCLVERPPEAERSRFRTSLLRLKLRPDTPQHYSDIVVRNVRLDANANLFSIEPWTQYFDLQGRPAPTQTVENVTVERVTGSANGFGRIAGPANATVRNIALRDIDVTLREASPTIRGVEGMTIENVRVNGEPLTTQPTTQAAN